MPIEIGDISLWEYVEGDKIKVSIKSNRIHTLRESILKIQNCKNKSRLIKNLVYMDSILTKMNVNDQHGDNYIFRKKPAEEVVPIDLEVIQEEKRSSLGTSADHELSKEEKQIVGEFNNRIQSRPDDFFLSIRTFSQDICQHVLLI